MRAQQQELASTTRCSCAGFGVNARRLCLGPDQAQRDADNLREKIAAFYLKHRANQIQEVDKLCLKYVGRESEMLKNLAILEAKFDKAAVKKEARKRPPPAKKNQGKASANRGGGGGGGGGNRSAGIQSNPAHRSCVASRTMHLKNARHYRVRSLYVAEVRSPPSGPCRQQVLVRAGARNRQGPRGRSRASRQWGRSTP